MAWDAVRFVPILLFIMVATSRHYTLSSSSKRSALQVIVRTEIDKVLWQDILPYEKKREEGSKTSAIIDLCILVRSRVITVYVVEGSMLHWI